MSDKVGGQEGHHFHTLRMVEKPDKIFTHLASRFNKFGLSLDETQVICYEMRQLFELPPINVEVTEHQA